MDELHNVHHYPLNLPSRQVPNQFLNRPNMVRQLRVHGWRLFVCGVNTTKVEMRDEQRNGVFQIRQLF